MNKTELHTLLDLKISEGAPAFIVYAEKMSNRLRYVSEFIFEHVLKVNVLLTDNKTEFENSKLFKINYSAQSLQNAFQVIPSGFLFEKNVSENKAKFSLNNDLIYFFENENNSAGSKINYDIFSAVFYFISRYEEWQDFKADMHGRFEAPASILFQNKMHLKPVVDHWILELGNALESFFKTTLPASKFKVISTIDVDNLYAYKEKGFLRTAGAIVKDILKPDLENLKQRIKVLSKKENDPFDIYSPVSDFCLQNKIPLIYFFLLRSGTKYDRTVDPDSKAFNNVFEQVEKRSALIGLHPSYYSSENKGYFEQEVKTFSLRSGRQVRLSRQHYLRFNIKTTPSLLIENNIIADFTLGFASDIGFRAGTSFPFYYYDFKTEAQKDLLFVPFCVMDGAYFVYNKLSPDEMQNSLLSLAAEVKKVKGIFISVFHERTFSNHLYPGYDRIYKNFHQKVKEL